MVESCRFESQAGSSGEVTVVLSLAYQATLHSGKTVYHVSGISASLLWSFTEVEGSSWLSTCEGFGG